MGRLIDTDSLKDRVSSDVLSEDEYNRFCAIIDAEPTAYDLDRVVERIESHMLKNVKTTHHIPFFGLETALIIVKEGRRDISEVATPATWQKKRTHKDEPPA